MMLDVVRAFGRRPRTPRRLDRLSICPYHRQMTTPPTRSKLSHLWIALCLAAGLAAGGYALWSWHQTSRPGTAHYLKGMDYAAARSYGQARDEWLAGTREDPTSPQCWVQLADFYAATRQYPEAARCYVAASKLLPQDGTVFLGLAQTEQALGQAPPAAAAAARAATLLPGDADAQALDGRLQYDLRNVVVALAAIRRANGLRPGDPAIVRELAQQEINRHDVIGAERDLFPYAQSHPQDVEAAYLMALIATQKPPTPDTLRTGLHYAQIARAGEPKDVDCLTVTGQLYLDSKQPQKALEAFLAAGRLAPKSEKALHGLVTAYAQTGNVPAAAAAASALQQIASRHYNLVHLVDTLLLNPADVTSRLRYARLLEADGQIRPAQVQYNRSVRQAPQDPRTRPSLASFLRRMGFPEQARQAERPDYLP